MKFDGNYRGSSKTDYEQFSSFLGINRPRNARVAPTFAPVTPNHNDTNCNKCRSLAMVYPEKQDFCGIYDPEIALINGTIFEELNLPFNRSKCSKNGGCFR